MKNHVITFGVIDYEGDVACAALTEEEADGIIEDSEADGGDFHKDTIYLYGEGILEEGLLFEVKTLLNKAKERGVSVDVMYPCLGNLVTYLEKNLK